MYNSLYECEKLKCRKGSMFALQNLNDNDDEINDIDNFSDCAISISKNIHDGNHESGTFLSATEIEYNDEEINKIIIKKEIKEKKIDKRFWWQSKILKTVQTKTDINITEKSSNNHSRNRSFTPFNNIHKSDIYDNSELASKNIFLEQV